jgi:RNA polymerase sigma-70 factor (ECF subfamily)
MYIDKTTDELLWQAFKEGDKAAYAYIYSSYFHILFSYGKKITTDEDLVQDCIQDLFIELLHRRQHLGSTDSIKFYLFKSLRRKLNHQLIKRDSKPLTEDLFEENDYEDFQVHPYEHELVTEQVINEQKAEILKALNLLTKSQKKAIELKFYQNLSYQEVAAVMCIHIDSVYNLISKATSFLKQNVKKVYILLSLLLFQ